MPISLRVTPLPAFRDNYLWVIHDTLNFKHVVVVDPGDATVVLNALKKHELELKAILITHHHHDHTGGLLALKKKLDVPVYGPANENIEGVDHKLSGSDRLTIKNTNLSFKILDLPGHTLGHIAYYGHSAVFCGDTLFSAGCGRMFEGTPEGFYSSLMTLAKLPGDTAVYCTHEYTAANLAFAEHVEPNNIDIVTYRTYVTEKRAKHQITLPSTIELERKINPFLHCEQESVQKYISQLCSKALPDLLGNPVNTFACMRQLKDNF